MNRQQKILEISNFRRREFGLSSTYARFPPPLESDQSHILNPIG